MSWMSGAGFAFLQMSHKVKTVWTRVRFVKLFTQEVLMLFVGIDIAKRNHEAAVINQSGDFIIKPSGFLTALKDFPSCWILSKRFR